MCTSKCLPIFVATTLHAACGLFAQNTFPDTDIYLADIHLKNDSIKVGHAINLTNRPGYDNQPAFSEDGSYFLFSSIREAEQADIYKYQIKEKKTTRLTTTMESEFSPTFTPDGKYYSVVRVERDSAQRVWKFSFGGAEPELVSTIADSVGYHQWINRTALAIFKLTNPISLEVVYTNSNFKKKITENIGRCIQTIPHDYALSFVQKTNDSLWFIKRLDKKTFDTTTIVKTLPGSEDYAWLPNGTLLMGQGSKLFALNPLHDTAWREVADFSNDNIKGFYRIAVSPKSDRIAIVVFKDKKP